jgi:hypothetical protein
MHDFCDTHGLDLPCGECIRERAEELEYVEKWSGKNEEEAE